MATAVHLKLKGSKTGNITGGGKDGVITVHAYSHEIVSPRDAASGLPTGKRQHKPLVITKEIDRATPLIASLLTNNEVISEFTLTVSGLKPTGVVGELFTVKLTNAAVASMRTEILNTAFPGNADQPPRESVSFVYQKISWTWVDGGITHEDSWAIEV